MTELVLWAIASMIVVQLLFLAVTVWLVRRILRVNERTEYLRSIDLSLRQLPAVQNFYRERAARMRRAG